MSSDGRLRRALAAFGGGGDVWGLVDAALAAAARDSPAELRARRDGIVQRLYAGAARCRNCDAPPPPAQPNGAVAAAAPAVAAAASPASPDEEVDEDGLDDDEADAGVESKILAIRDFLEDPDQVLKYPIFTALIDSTTILLTKGEKRLTASLQSVPLSCGLLTVGGRDGEPAAEPSRHGHHLQGSPGQTYF
jgi:hypothetical protein